MPSMQERAADTITAVLSAPLVATYTYIILVLSQSPPVPASIFVASSFFVSVLPLIIIFYSRRRGIIGDIYASDRKKRTKPFIGAIVSYLLGVIVLCKIGAPGSFVALMACYLVNSLVMMFITRAWKISIHASGIAGPATFLVHQLGARMLPFGLFILPVAWARVRLKAHNLVQVTAGVVLTAGLTFIQLEFYSRLTVCFV